MTFSFFHQIASKTVLTLISILTQIFANQTRIYADICDDLRSICADLR